MISNSLKEAALSFMSSFNFYQLVWSYFSKKKNTTNYYKNIVNFETFRTVAWSIAKLRPPTISYR